MVSGVVILGFHRFGGHYLKGGLLARGPLFSIAVDEDRLDVDDRRAVDASSCRRAGRSTGRGRRKPKALPVVTGLKTNAPRAPSRNPGSFLLRERLR